MIPGFTKHKVVIFLATGDRECTEISARDESSALFFLQRELEKCVKEGKFYITIPNHVAVNPRYIVKLRNDFLKSR